MLMFDLIVMGKVSKPQLLKRNNKKKPKRTRIDVIWFPA